MNEDRGVPAWAAIAIAALPAAWIASVITTDQVRSSAICADNATHRSCGVDGTFAAGVVVVPAVAAAISAAVRRWFPLRRGVEWIPAGLWVLAVIATCCYPPPVDAGRGRMKAE